MSARSPRGSGARAALALRSVLLLALALLLAAAFSPFSDGALSVPYLDGVVYGLQLEGSPFAPTDAPVVRPEHALFHVLSLPLAAALRGAGLGEPGHVAVRLLSAAGGALVLLAVAGNARPRRAVGVLFAALLASTRLFPLHAGVGETTLPALAAELLTAHLVARSDGGAASTRRIGACFVLALFLRQDALFLAPGLAWALADSWPAGTRLRRLATFFGVTGAATLAGYLLLWWWADPAGEPATFLAGAGRDARPFGFAAAYGFHPRFLAEHLANLGASVAGRHHAAHAPGIAIGIAFAAGTLLCGRLLAGDEPVGRYARVALTFVALWVPFGWWYSPRNWETHVATVTWVVALAARTTRGAPCTSLARRRAGAALGALLVVALLVAHGPTTLGLRREGLVDSVRAVRAEVGPGCVLLATTPRVETACRRVDVPSHLVLTDAELQAEVLERLEAGAAPFAVLVDAFARDGMPFSLAPERTEAVVEAARELGGEPIRFRGRVCAVRFAPR